MKQTHIDRLLKLADHLEHGQLGHQVFDFNSYNTGQNGKSHHAPSCGYAGCAIGECPVIFSEWRYDLQGWPYLPGHESIISIQVFFGLNWASADHLFMPNSQEPSDFGGKHLSVGATKEQVAANIRAFVALKLPTVEKD